MAPGGRSLGELLDATGRSDEELALELGVHPSTVWRWRKAGDRPRTREQIENLMRLLSLTVDELGGAILRNELRKQPPSP